MTDTIRQSQIKEKIHQLIHEANQKYGYAFDISKLQIFFTLKGRCAGKAIYPNSTQQKYKGKYTLNFNWRIATADIEYLYSYTIPHEVAHVLVYFMHHKTDRHGTKWKSVCLSLGGNGKVKHNIASTIIYDDHVFCDKCGAVVGVSKRSYRSIQNGGIYMHLTKDKKYCGKIYIKS